LSILALLRKVKWLSRATRCMSHKIGATLVRAGVGAGLTPLPKRSSTMLTLTCRRDTNHYFSARRLCGVFRAEHHRLHVSDRQFSPALAHRPLASASLQLLGQRQPEQARLEPGGGGYRRWLNRSGGKTFFIKPFAQGTSLGFSERWSSLGKTS